MDNLPSKIFLIGLPGSGKTTLGKELAKKLSLHFLDLDIEIEKQVQKSIQAIFKDHSEPYFRKLESRILKELCSSDQQFVMATGGGTPCFFENMKVINEAGKSIFIDVATKEIAKRVKHSSLNKRPLFENLHQEELKDKIEFLRSQRMPFYQQAHVHLKGDKIHLQDLLFKLSQSEVNKTI